jgi:peptidyl-prolyl cis-trans isomerase C
MLSRLLCAALVLPLVACSQRAASEYRNDGTRASQGALVARVGKVELREEDVQSAIARDPGGSPARFAIPAARSELVDGLVRFELLAQAAERAGLTRDPDALHALRQIAVTKLVNQTLGAVASPQAITQVDIEREYQARQASEFTLPEAVQVRHIRLSDAKLAERIAGQARALSPADDRGFAALASSVSEDTATRQAGGDLGFIDKSSRVPGPLLEAALRLKTPGEVAGPFQVDGGYEVLRLVSLRAAAVSPLSSVQEPIRQRLYRERRAKALDDFIAKLRAETPIELSEVKPQ